MAKGKSEYWRTPDGLIQIEGWARDGLTMEQIAQNMGISRETLNVWSKKYSDISDTLKRARAIADRNVENALYQNAIGYEYKETEEKTRKTVEYDENGRKVREVIEPVTVEKICHRHPDVTAQIFWLKNRKPEVWREKQDVRVSGELTTEKSKLDEMIKQISGDA